MKKVLSILASLGITAATVSTVVACSDRTEKKAVETANKDEKLIGNDKNDSNKIKEQKRIVDDLNKQLKLAEVYLEEAAKNEQVAKEAAKSNMSSSNDFKEDLENLDKELSSISKKQEHVQKEIDEYNGILVELSKEEFKWANDELEEIDKAYSKLIVQYKEINKPSDEYWKHLQKCKDDAIKFKDQLTKLVDENTELEKTAKEIKKKQLQIEILNEEIEESREEINDPDIEEELREFHEINIKKLNEKLDKVTAEYDTLIAQNEGILEKYKEYSSKKGWIKKEIKITEDEVIYLVSEKGIKEAIEINRLNYSSILPKLESDMKKLIARKSAIKLRGETEYSEEIKETFSVLQGLIKSKKFLSKQKDQVTEHYNKITSLGQPFRDKQPELDKQLKSAKEETAKQQLIVNNLKEKLEQARAYLDQLNK